jgi:hypothetical protein
VRLIMIGRIYLLKSSEAERCILPDDAHQKPPARADCAKTAPKSSSAQSGHLADQQKYHSYVSVLLRKGAFKVFRFQSAPRRRPLAFAHVQNALSHLPVSKTPIQACMHPKRLRVRPNLKRPLTIICIQGALLRWPNPKRPFALACIQIALLSLPVPKALHALPSPKQHFAFA